MTSKPGQMSYINQGNPGSSAAAGAFLASQEAEKKAAAAASSAEPAEKKDDSEAVAEKKEEEEPSKEEPAPPAPTATAAPTTTDATAAAPIAEASGPSSSEKKEEASAESSKDAEEPVPTTTAVPSSSDPTWPETPADHPLTQLVDALPKLLEEAAYDEVYGITLSPSAPFHTKLILQKFLRANANDITNAKSQLLDTLKWRKEFQPAKAVQETFGKEFADLGYILELGDMPDSTNEIDVVTFSVYGAIKNKKETFGDVEK